MYEEIIIAETQRLELLCMITMIQSQFKEQTLNVMTFQKI